VPSEAVSWGKVEPEALPDTIVCYTDSTIALPILTAYVMSQCAPRPLKRLYDRRPEFLARIQREYLEAKYMPRSPEAGQPVATYPCGTPIAKTRS
jgi:deoxyhypusine synthase